MQTKQKIRIGIVLVVAVLIFMLGVAISNNRTATFRTIHLRDMKEVLLALQTYEENSDRLPQDYRSNNEVLNSWRFQMISFVTSVTSREAYRDRRWDAPDNASWAAKPMSPYCWTDSPFTNVMGIRGPDSAFRADGDVSLAKLPGNCIVFIEVDQERIHWMEPGDVDATDWNRAANDFLRGRSGKDDFFVAFADGEIWLLSRSVPVEVLEPFLTVTGAQTADRTSSLEKYRVIFASLKTS